MNSMKMPAGHARSMNNADHSSYSYRVISRSSDETTKLVF